MKYVAKRVKLAKPKVVEIMGTKITYNFKIDVKAKCN